MKNENWNLNSQRPLSEREEKSKELLSSLKFCVFDLETTGGNQKSDNIIEIGLVKIQNLKITDRKTYLIRPDVKIPEFIQKLTTIREEDVKDAPTIEKVIDEILLFMEDSILVAHNISFDVPFFNSVLVRLKRPPLPNKSICTNLMTKYLIPNLLNTNLNYMSKIFDIGHHQAHRALDDALASADLLLTYLDIFIKKEITKINHLYYPRNKYELDRSHYKSDEISKDELLEKVLNCSCPILITMKGENGIIQSALPFFTSDEEKRNSLKQFLTTQFEQFKWETISIRLFGSFAESFMHFASIYPKVESHHRGEIIAFLRKTILNDAKPFLGSNFKKDSNEAEITNYIEQKLGDFLIIKHIVPEQLIVVPLLSFSTKNQMIFRYPGHQKKLLQYINSRAGKLSSMKNKSLLMQGPLRDFYFDYLNLQNNIESKEIKIFHRSLPQKNPTSFLETLGQLSGPRTNGYQFPKNHL